MNGRVLWCDSHDQRVMLTSVRPLRCAMGRDTALAFWRSTGRHDTCSVYELVRRPESKMQRLSGFNSKRVTS
jgi:hypothetical protein